MGSSDPDIDALKKPSELLDADLAGGASSPLHPGEFLRLKPLVPETKAIPRPIQDFHLVATSVDEEKQGARKNIHLELHFHNRRQAINRLSEVDVIPVQENLADLMPRVH